MTYEEREANALKTLAAAWKCDVHPFAKYDILDFWCARKQTFAVGEYKWRDYEKDDFATTWLRFTKWLALGMSDKLLGLASFYVVEFRDGLYYVNVKELTCPPCTFEVGGRLDRPARGEWDKYQPMIGVPRELLRAV